MTCATWSRSALIRYDSSQPRFETSTQISVEFMLQQGKASGQQNSVMTLGTPILIDPSASDGREVVLGERCQCAAAGDIAMPQADRQAQRFQLLTLTVAAVQLVQQLVHLPTWRAQGHCRLYCQNNLSLPSCSPPQGISAERNDDKEP